MVASKRLAPCLAAFLLLILAEAALGDTVDEIIITDTYASRNASIGAFNIRILGDSKMGKPAVVETLVKIIRQYHMILIQEIRDKDMDSIYSLHDEVNAGWDNYMNMTLSSRTGRSSSKEQYAYMYRNDTFYLVEAAEYDDGDEATSSDQYEREPYVAKFASVDVDAFQFIAIGVHTKPTDAVAEITHLVDVYNWASAAMNEKRVMIIGDLNADCSYFNSSSRNTNPLRTDDRFIWLTDDDADTTVSSTDCAYDRLIVTPQLNEFVYPSSVTVDRFDLTYGLTEAETEDVSDHYPVAMVMGYSWLVSEEEEFVEFESDSDESFAYAISGSAFICCCVVPPLMFIFMACTAMVAGVSGRFVVEKARPRSYNEMHDEHELRPMYSEPGQRAAGSTGPSMPAVLQGTHAQVGHMFKNPVEKELESHMRVLNQRSSDIYETVNQPGATSRAPLLDDKMSSDPVVYP